MPARTIFLSLFIFPFLCYGQKYFDFNDNCQQAYSEIIRLKLDGGQQILDAEKKLHPGNLIPYFLENYIDFFILFFNEDPTEYKARKPNSEKRIKLMGQGPESSPWYLFSKSVIHFQWAAVKIKLGTNWDAGWEFRRSFLQSKENQQQFPLFSPGFMTSGTMRVAAGTIPDGYKWLSNILGIKGSIGDGMQQLEQFIAQNDPWAILFRNEAIFYYLYLKFYIENKRDEVFAFIAQHKLDLKNNHLFAYLATNLAINNQQSAYAQRIIRQRNNAAGYMDSPVWDLEMGYARMNHLEPDANVYLERFIDRFKGKFYVKDVLQKLSWFYYLQENQQRAIFYRQQITEKGSTDTDSDKQALKESGDGKWPDKSLLKARLLDDGGYYAEALQVLQGKTAGDFSSAEEKLEFTYRLGRIYDGLQRDEDAIAAYLNTIEQGRQRKEYFAAKAALQIGYIYEKHNDKKAARTYFQQVIDLKDHDYKNSLDQKAKAGIERCKM